MTFSHLTYFKIPKRAKTCQYCDQPFKPGDEIISRIREEKNEYLREDYLLSCRSEISSEEGWVYWNSVIPAKEKVDKSPKTKIERAQKLLHSLIEKPQEDQQATLYVLSLFLQRQKQLFLKREYQKQGHSHLIYEEPLSGEVFTLRRPELSSQQVKKTQDFIAKTLQGEALSLESA